MATIGHSPDPTAAESLVYTTDQSPGYRRIRRGRGFCYLLPDDTKLTDKKERMRIRKLAIPPAYRDVWICMTPNGHLQATGIDARGRKQYRYHPAWMIAAADRKFGMLLGFARALPRIRARISKDLNSRKHTRERAIAGIVALLDRTGFRIGNAEYARINHTYGLATLLSRHLKEDGRQITLSFRGKSGQRHRMQIISPRLAQLVSDLQELPGQQLFRYEDAAGAVHDLGTADVNAWLNEAAGGDYTAKQFRTWKATVLCARELGAEPPPPTLADRKAALRNAIKATAVKLNHTVTVCRQYYVHPALIAAYPDGDVFRIMNSAPPRLRKSDGTSGLHADERRVFKLLTMHSQGAHPT